MKKTRCLPLCLLALVLSVPVLHAQPAEPLTDTGERIAILTFNDFHGAFIENKASESPGIARMVSCIKALQKKYKNSNLVSAGDNFAGSYFSKTTEAGIWLDIKKEFGGTIVSTLGNHEFDWGKDFLKKSNDREDFYYSANNFTPDKDSGVTINKLGWIKTLKLSNGDSVVLDKTALMTRETKGKSGDRAGWFTVGDPLDVLKDAKNDPEKLDVLIAHIGTQGGSKPAFMPDRYDKDHTQDVSKLATSGAFDVVVTGHSHNEVYGTLGGVPVVQAGCYGKYIGVVVFKLMKNKENKNRFQFDTCYLEPVANYEPDPEVQRHIDRWLGYPHYRFLDSLAKCAVDIRYSRGNLFRFMDIGGLVTSFYADFYEQKIGSGDILVFGVSNAKGIRNGLSKGVVYRKDAGDVLPLDGDLQAFRLTGAEFKKLIQDGMNNPDGWIQTHDLSVHYKFNKSTRKNEVLGVSLILDTLSPNEYEVTQLKDSQEVIVVIEKFLATGNDGYDKTLFTKPVSEFNALPDRKTTTVFIEFLKQQQGLIHPFYTRAYSFREV